MTVSSTVSSIKHGADPDTLVVGFSDGSSFSLRLSYLPPETAQCIVLGRELDPDDACRIESASECLGAEKCAAGLIARSEHCRFGLSRKLERRGFSRAAAEAALTRLESLGLLDDGRFARLWIRSRLVRGSDSPKRLLAALAGKGIPRQTAMAEVRAACTPEQEAILIGRFLKKRGPPEHGGRDALKGYLRSAGYTPPGIAAALAGREG